MDTELAKKCVREARELHAKQISFHITGESLLHTDLLEILPRDYPILISTNCIPLEGPLARSLADMKNLTIILAVAWSDPEKRMLTSLLHASSYLQMNPVNRLDHDAAHLFGTRSSMGSLYVSLFFPISCQAAGASASLQAAVYTGAGTPDAGVYYRGHSRESACAG